MLTRRLPVFAVTVVSQAAGLAGLLVALALHGEVGGRAFLLGLAAGVGGGAGLAAFYKALSLGTMSVVSPIAACGAVVPFALALARGERPSVWAVGGAVVALAGAVLASAAEGRASGDRQLGALLVVVAAIAIGRTARRRVSSGSEALIGACGEARSSLDADPGQVFVDGALWRARPCWNEDERLRTGDRVVVERVEGVTLSVRRAEEWELET